MKLPFHMSESMTKAERAFFSWLFNTSNLAVPGMTQTRSPMAYPASRRKPRVARDDRMAALPRVFPGKRARIFKGHRP